MSENNGELPHGWAIETIGNLCELNPKHESGVPNDLPVSFVPMAAVCDQLGQITASETRPFHEVRKGYTHFADGDVIFAKITPCMENGKAASVRGLVNAIGCGTTEFFVFRSRGAIDQDYLFHFIRQETYRKAARETMQSGVGQARVPKEFVVNTSLPVAPLTEQRRIVEKIEALQTRSRRAREALAEVGPLLEQFRQSLLAAALRGDLTAAWRETHPDVEPASELLKRIRVERRRRWEQAELAKFNTAGKSPPKNWQAKYKEPAPVDDPNLPELPPTWCWATVDQLAVHLSGFAFKSGDFVKAGLQVIRLGNLYQGRFDLTRDPTFLPSGHRDAHEARVYGGDILVSQTGTRYKRDYGHFVLVPSDVGPFLLNQRVLAVRCIEPALASWLVHASSLEVYRDHLFSTETGGVNQGNVGVGGVMRGPVPLAPAAECQEVLKRLSGAIESYSELKKLTLSACSELESLDQSILAKAFRGELVPQDPSDEPASVMLERLRAEWQVAANQYGTQKMMHGRRTAQKGQR